MNISTHALTDLFPNKIVSEKTSDLKSLKCEFDHNYNLYIFRLLGIDRQHFTHQHMSDMAPGFNSPQQSNCSSVPYLTGSILPLQFLKSKRT